MYNEKMSILYRLLSLFGLCFSALALAEPLRIETGLIEGRLLEESGVRVFKGIPFAAPPVGQLRWQAPQAVETWSGVFKADEFGPSCMQALTRRYLPWTEEYMISNDVSEDCLTLNIWVPAKHASGSSGDSQHAVLVYIHGGAYTGGGSQVAIYDGEQLARKGIVVVTVNYRVGIFGFLAHKELSQQQGQSGNYGLLDNIAALQWVKKNIAVFGGDPEQVTIAGQSAGARSVHYLSVSPLAKGLFQGAIAQSGPWRLGSHIPDLKEAENLSADYLRKWKLNNLTELRALSAEDLQTREVEFSRRFLPNIDGYVLPASVEERHKKGQAHKLPLLTGITADEGSSNSAYGKASVKAFIGDAKRTYSLTSDSIFWDIYKASTDLEAGIASRQVARDKGLFELQNWASFRKKHMKVDTFAYFFKRKSPWPEYPQYGAFHSSELPFVFNNLHLSPKAWTDKDKLLAERMSAYWVNFVKTGNPNSSALPVWPKAENKMITFDVESKLENSLSEEKMQLWRELL